MELKLRRKPIKVYLVQCPKCKEKQQTFLSETKCVYCGKNFSAQEELIGTLVT
jgi:ribosomal protein S27E